MKKKILITIIILLCALIAVEIAATASSRNVGVGDEDSEFTPDMLTETIAETASLPTETPTPTPIPEPEPDTTAPFFMNINRDAWVAVGNEFNINDFVSYIDNIDSDVELDISGYVDTSVTGTYHLDLTITDDEGNSCSDTMNVTVYQPSGDGSGGDYTGTTTENATPFADFMAAYQGDSIHYGIDVSKWQGDINWQSVADAGCEFVFIRAGWSSAGEFHEDEYFIANMEGATAAGIPIGIYVYTTDNTVEDVTALADLICDMADGYNVQLPIVFDWENFFSGFQKYHLSIADMNVLYHAFDDQVRARGYSSMLYGSKFIFEIIWDDDILNVWLAHYTSQTDYAGFYRIWQQSCTGTIPGIDAYVDMDLYYGDLPGGNNG